MRSVFFAKEIAQARHQMVRAALLFFYLTETEEAEMKSKQQANCFPACVKPVNNLSTLACQMIEDSTNVLYQHESVQTCATHDRTL